MSWHKKDPVMTKLVKSLPAPKNSKKDDLYLTLLDSVIGQQLSVVVADAIFLRFCGLFKDNYPDAKKLLRMTEEELRGVGLSRAKVVYVKAVAEYHLEHPITQKRLSHLTDDEIITDLTQIKGIGLWSVQMLLMFAMDRPDVFAHGDLIIRQMMIEHYNVTEKGAAQIRRLTEIAESWQPMRTLACRYLWSAKGAAKAAQKLVEKAAKPKIKAKKPS